MAISGLTNFACSDYVKVTAGTTVYLTVCVNCQSFCQTCTQSMNHQETKQSESFSSDPVLLNFDVFYTVLHVLSLRKICFSFTCFFFLRHFYDPFL